MHLAFSVSLECENKWKIMSCILPGLRIIPGIMHFVCNCAYASDFLLV